MSIVSRQKYFHLKFYPAVILFFATILFLWITPVFAQQWNFGVKGGPSFSRINAENIENETSRRGYHIGMFIGKQFTDVLHLNTEVLYSAQGSTLERMVERRNETFPVTWESNINYIQLPITARVIPAKFIHLDAGIGVGYLVGVTVSRDGDRFNSFDEVDRSNFKNMDWSIILGAGFNLHTVTIGGRWQRAVTGFPDSAGADRIMKGAVNNVFQLYLGYILPKKGR